MHAPGGEAASRVEGAGAKTPPTLTDERFASSFTYVNYGMDGGGAAVGGTVSQGGGSSCKRLQLAAHHHTKQNLLLMRRTLEGNACVFASVHGHRHAYK